MYGASYQPHTFGARQDVVNASFGYSAVELARQAELDRQRRFFDPVFDPNFVMRIAGSVDHDLIRRASELHDSLALQTLTQKVEAAATIRMTEFWKLSPGALGTSSFLAAQAARGFQNDMSIMTGEAVRMLSIYGPSIAEQTYFLTEYQLNLGLFRAGRLDAGAYQGADLLARVVLPSDILPPFDDYQEFRIERLRSYGTSLLIELEEDFQREPNPVFVWKAFRTAESCGVEIPEWVLDRIAEVAERICDLGEEDTVSEHTLTEAERIGKALGFSQGGKGTTGRFAHAKQIERDRAMYYQVEDWMAEQRLHNPKPKLTRAYAEIADQFGVEATMVGRAYRRMRGYVRREEDIEN